LRSCSLAVFGDFCIDAYWALHEGASEFSVETSLRVRQVKMQRYSLGGAGNVLTNLAALKVGHIQAIGVSGTDPFGAVMQDLLNQHCDYRCDVIRDPSWETMVYAKPCVGTREESRIDFGAFNDPDQVLADQLLGQLERAAGEHDVVILNQQVESGVSSPKLIERINGIIARSRKAVFLVDARHHPEKYTGALLKVNMSEAAKLLGEEPVSLHEDARAIEFASRIHALTSKPAFVTRGERGIAVATDGAVDLIAGLHVEGPTDAVGAGDTVVATVAAALATGASPWQAGTLANLAAMITVRKLQTTGTASPEEILSAASILKFDRAESTGLTGDAISSERGAV
jgi:rfaE bifunctional protein kinase chain/domain